MMAEETDDALSTTIVLLMNGTTDNPGYQPVQHNGRELVTQYFGPEMAGDLLRRENDICSAFGANIDSVWEGTHSVEQIVARAIEECRIEHPELSELALRTLGSRMSYGFR
jgi:hypothetical protein